MCDPLIIGGITAALGVGETVLSYVGQRNLSITNQQYANLDYAARSDTLQQQRVQLDQERTARAEDTAIATAQAEGRIAASAADRGLGAASTSQLLHSAFFGIARQDSIADVNDLNQRVQLANEQRGAAISRDSRIAASPRPSVLGLALGVGKAGLSGYNSYQGAKRAGTT